MGFDQEIKEAKQELQESIDRIRATIAADSAKPNFWIPISQNEKKTLPLQSIRETSKQQSTEVYRLQQDTQR